MFKTTLKKFLKSELIEKVIGKILYYYLKLVKVTSNVEIEYDIDFNHENFMSCNNTIFALWHQELALSILTFEPISSKVSPLISPHSDGKLFSNVVANTGAKIISGSTNKHAANAIKSIIQTLKSGGNIVITPDGPTGPAKIINSNIMAIAAKTASHIVALSIKSSRYIEFNSWDKFHFPLPFSKIKIKFAAPIKSSSEKQIDNDSLQQTLNQLSHSSVKAIKPSTGKGFELFLMIASIILFPFQLIMLMYRLIKGKETFERVLERFSLASDVSHEGMIWIHAASVGESIVAFSLIDMLLKQNRNLKFLLTTGTITSANLAASKMEHYNHFSAKQVITHQFIPIDNIFISTHFINYWKPKLGIFIESELWPNTIYAASLVCPLILVNARMSGRSFARWQSCKFIIHNIAKRFTHTFVQSNQDKERFEILGFNDVCMLGNLKYVQKDDMINIDIHSKITNQIGDRKIIFAASTHSGEDEIIINIFKKLKIKHENLLLVIAPRHPNRTADIINFLNAKKLKVVKRTSDEIIKFKTDVFILDTIGEMAMIYKLRPITFMGGTFTIGGHNILEPAKYESLIIYGPDMSNFQEISNEFIEKKAAFQVKTKEDLYEVLEEILTLSVQEIAKYTNSALEIMKSKQMVEKIYMQKLNPYLSLE